MVITPESIESSEETVSEATTTPSPPGSPVQKVAGVVRLRHRSSSSTVHPTSTSDSADSSGVAVTSNAILVPTYEVEISNIMQVTVLCNFYFNY